MNAIRIGLAVLLFAGCTKAAAPPPQPPPDDDAAQPEEPDEPEASEAVAEVDSSVRIEGSLKEDQVRAVAQDHFSEIQKCFDEALAHMGDSINVNGAVAVRMEIDAGGKVTSVELEASSFGDEETPACIIGKVETWTFPKGKKPSTVTYPFFLRSY